MKATKPYKVGDIFCFEIAANEYGFGRVLFDFDQQALHTKKADYSSNLYLHKAGTILVELYRETASEKRIDLDKLEVAVASFFTGNSRLLRGLWEVVDHLMVDPTILDFPEFMTVQGATHGKYTKGEIHEIVELGYGYDELLIIPLSEEAIVTIPHALLFALGRKDEIDIPEDKKYLRDFSQSDYRKSVKRKEIEHLIPEDMKNLSYYEMSKARGFDLKRFYE